jgi:hypothetical protein
MAATLMVERSKPGPGAKVEVLEEERSHPVAAGMEAVLKGEHSWSAGETEEAPMEEHSRCVVAGGLEGGLVEEHTDTDPVVETAEALEAAHSWGLQKTAQVHGCSCSGDYTGYCSRDGCCCRDLPCGPETAPCGLERVASEPAEAQAHQSVRFCCRNT